MKRALRDVTRRDVLDAMGAFNEVGEERFLARHGYEPSTTYRVLHGEQTYPSKAILGVAAGLAPRDFFGGVAQTVGRLQSLGFVVLKGRRRVPSLRLLRRAQQIDVAVVADPMLPAQPTAAFASGSNAPGEIRGLSSCGVDVGVAAPHVASTAEVELLALAGTDVNVFVDSGAFSEVKFGPDGPEVVGEITADEWQRRLSLYKRLAEALGSQAWVVAPDRVGDQVETIKRLRRYAGELRELRGLGARVLVPLQRGELSLSEFAAIVDAILLFTDWTPALPCKKAATNPDEVEAFVVARRPRHVHLLGLGSRNRRANDYLAPFAGDDRPSVSLDANWITANVGLRPKPRRYTLARQQARRVLGAAAAGALVSELALLACHGAL